jgi:hypothetical protein
MKWPVDWGRMKLDEQSACSSRESRVVRDREANLEQMYDGTDKPLSLSQRQMETSRRIKQQATAASAYRLGLPPESDLL